MADKTVPNLSSMGLDLKLKDLGDGSFALVVRAYPNNPEARKAIRAQAKWRKAA